MSFTKDFIKFWGSVKCFITIYSTYAQPASFHNIRTCAVVRDDPPNSFWWSYCVFWCHCVSCPFKAVLLLSPPPPIYTCWWGVYCKECLAIVTGCNLVQCINKDCCTSQSYSIFLATWLKQTEVATDLCQHSWQYTHKIHQKLIISVPCLNA
jgi:hypothetical protein